MSTNSNEREVEPAMDRINESSEQIDRATSRSICRGVGERLRQDLPPKKIPNCLPISSI
jgi:hypothetical protein